MGWVPSQLPECNTGPCCEPGSRSICFLSVTRASKAHLARCLQDSLFLLTPPTPQSGKAQGATAPVPGWRELVSSTPDRFSFVGFVDSMTEEDELAEEPQKDKQTAGELSERTEFQRGRLWNSINCYRPMALAR